RNRYPARIAGQRDDRGGFSEFFQLAILLVDDFHVVDRRVVPASRLVEQSDWFSRTTAALAVLADPFLNADKLIFNRDLDPSAVSGLRHSVEKHSFRQRFRDGLPIGQPARKQLVQTGVALVSAGSVVFAPGDERTKERKQKHDLAAHVSSSLAS